MKKVFSPLGVFILFTVGAFLSGFFGLWGETWFNNLFGRESKPSTEKKTEQSGDFVQCEYCGQQIPKEEGDSQSLLEFHMRTCPKKP